MELNEIGLARLRKDRIYTLIMAIFTRTGHIFVASLLKQSDSNTTKLNEQHDSHRVIHLAQWCQENYF